MSSQKCTILITGSNSGIGYDLVKLLASKGHIVYLTARNEVAGKEAQPKLEQEHNLSVKFVQLDVTDLKSVQATKDTVEKAEGKLDVLVNNAGSCMDTPQNAPTIDISLIALARELSAEGIKVNAVTPGFTTTKLNGYAVGRNTTEQAAESLAEWALLGPEDKYKTGLFWTDKGEFPR